MSTSSKVLAAAVVVVAVVAIYGAYLYPKVSFIAGGAGNTFSTAKIAAIAANLSAPGTTGTTTSILNTDAGTRYVTGIRYACDSIGTSQTAYTGAGLANWTLTIGTSSTANANTIGATAKLLNGVTIPTTSVMTAAATSTSGLAGASAAALWHSGEYMTFQFNATNTAACTVGVDYIGS